MSIKAGNNELQDFLQKIHRMIQTDVAQKTLQYNFDFSNCQPISCKDGSITERYKWEKVKSKEEMIEELNDL